MNIKLYITVMSASVVFATGTICYAAPNDKSPIGMIFSVSVRILSDYDKPDRRAQVIGSLTMPEYPAELIVGGRGLAGDVHILIKVNNGGEVEDTTVETTTPGYMSQDIKGEFEKSAKTAINKWRFLPASGDRYLRCIFQFRIVSSEDPAARIKFLDLMP